MKKKIKRLLEVGEEIKSGDKFYRHGEAKWVEIFAKDIAMVDPQTPYRMGVADLPTYREEEVSFHELTPAEAERLYLLMEECGEVLQVIGKILRHGYESSHPESVLSPVTNRQDLERELGHVFCAITLLARVGDVSAYEVSKSEEAKHKSVKAYLHHQEG